MSSSSSFGSSSRGTVAAIGFLALTGCSSGASSGTGGGTTTKTGTGGTSTTSSSISSSSTSSSSTSSSSTSSSSTSSSSTSSSSTSSSSGAPTCAPGMTYGGGEPLNSATKTVTAKIVDETGTPVAAGQPVYLCGINICSPPTTTGAGGTVSITSNLAENKPALKVGDTINYAEIAIPLTMNTVDFTAGGTKVISTAKLSGKPGAVLTPGTDAISGDVTLSIPAGDSVGLDLITYPTPDVQMFRAVSIPLANEGPWLAASGKTDFALLYGVTPAETLFCPAVKVTVALPHTTTLPNDLGWAPGTAVEFWAMTVDTGQTYAPYAGWAKQSGGTVSADGKNVVSTDGFIYLDNFAIRKAQ